MPCPRRGRALLFFQRDTSFFRKLFDELKPDLVHGWGTEDSYGLVARKLAPIYHVIGIQGLIDAYRKYLPHTYRTAAVLLTERLSLRKARNLLAESQYSLDAATQLCKPERQRVIEHPLRHEFVASQPSDGTGKTALFVGTIEARKGIGDAVTAFARVASPDWTLHVVGHGSSASERTMHQLADHSGIAGRFQHSRTLDAPALVSAMQNSSVFLLPTQVDTGPTALKEALTMGLWPVCYDNSGPAEYVRKYAFGSLARNRSVDSLCIELKQCFSEMPWKDVTKQAALAQRTREDFSPRKAWRELIAFYQLVVSKP